MLPNIDIKNGSSEVKCENCECTTFQQTFFIRKISKLIALTDHDSYVPVPTFQCSSCGHINKEFTPNFSN